MVGRNMECTRYLLLGRDMEIYELENIALIFHFLVPSLVLFIFRLFQFTFDRFSILVLSTFRTPNFGIF